MKWCLPILPNLKLDLRLDNKLFYRHFFLNKNFYTKIDQDNSASELCSRAEPRHIKLRTKISYTNNNLTCEISFA